MNDLIASIQEDIVSALKKVKDSYGMVTDKDFLEALDRATILISTTEEVERL